MTYLAQDNYLAYDKDLYMYHAYKVFDDDPQTAWLDGKEGPGIGSFIEIKFNTYITVDAIEVYPGLFDKRWYKKNNRIKKCIVKLDGNEYEINFKDEMKGQKHFFDSPKKFKSFSIIIKDIYKTTKWDDTALSEIYFYNNDQKIDIDTANFSCFGQTVDVSDLSESFIGTWHDMEEIPGSVGEIYRFYGDGSFVYNLPNYGAVEEYYTGAWELKKKKLILRIQDHTYIEGGEEVIGGSGPVTEGGEFVTEVFEKEKVEEYTISDLNVSDSWLCTCDHCQISYLFNDIRFFRLSQDPDYDYYESW